MSALEATIALSFSESDYSGHLPWVPPFPVELVPVLCVWLIHLAEFIQVVTCFSVPLLFIFSCTEIHILSIHLLLDFLAVPSFWLSWMLPLWMWGLEPALARAVSGSGRTPGSGIARSQGHAVLNTLRSRLLSTSPALFYVPWGTGISSSFSTPRTCHFSCSFLWQHS